MAAVSWTDSAGNFWLFGGFGEDIVGGANAIGPLNDLWEYSPSSGAWSWVGGSGSIGCGGIGCGAVYGTSGVPAPGNIPAANSGAVSWVDSAGNLWLFGGYNKYSNTFFDLWVYTPLAP
jgi:N-acetylneuraminic acid mutarotase